ncbi:protein PIN-LIKES 3-like [Solanum dulcamara]|uniref:protein PIN-LIKES 3-like n=1 Tax=Solanum dulcamara TaxID=45834 RepID=UPI002485F2BF|nr:protein PIN-LIKES 3-like [Solanum dulcamara]
MAFVELFVVALVPVLKTLIITAVGLFLALERVNLLGSTARHHLNNLVFYIFTPALVASSLAETVTSTNIVSLWFMPVNILLTFIIGSALGWILVKITTIPVQFHGLVISCCAAGNLGNLLLIIIPAVCEEKNSPFGDSITCSTNGKAYASLSMAVGAVYIWTYIYNMIRASGTQHHTSTEITKLPSRCIPEKDMDHEAQLALPLIGYQNTHDHQGYVVKKMKQHIKIWTEKINFKMLFAPSTIATIVGILIGVSSLLRKQMIGNEAPLHFIHSSASMLGEATIPAMTLIVGANLLKGLKKSGVGMWVVIGIQVIRYVALPLSGICVVKAARHFGLVGTDSLYQFVLLLQYALPSAMTIGTITQLFEVGESECSVIMLWNYALASVALTLWTTYYMWVLS